MPTRSGALSVNKALKKEVYGFAKEYFAEVKEIFAKVKEYFAGVKEKIAKSRLDFP